MNRCKHPHHADCNKTRSCLLEPEDVSIRVLKQWALFALEPDCTSKKKHKDAWARVVTMVSDGSLPPESQLDEQVILDESQCPV